MRVVKIEKRDEPCPVRDPHDRGMDYETMIITMDDGRTIRIGIEVQGFCCEEFGINDDDGPEDPYELEFSDVRIVMEKFQIGSDLNSKHGIEFLDSEGNRICLWYVYNIHNLGFYPHKSYVKDLNDKYEYEIL